MLYCTIKFHSQSVLCYVFNVGEFKFGERTARDDN